MGTFPQEKLNGAAACFVFLAITQALIYFQAKPIQINTFIQPSKFSDLKLENIAGKEPLPVNNFRLEHCLCQRLLGSKTGLGKVGIEFAQTTCGRDAYARGPGQKVVAFTIYGDVHSKQAKRRQYFQGEICFCCL